MQPRYRALLLLGLMLCTARMVELDRSPTRPTSQPPLVLKTEPVPRSRPAEMFFPVEVQAKLKSAVEAILPKGWSIKTHLGCSPSDWHTLDDQAGFCVEAAGGGDWLRVWFLPVDWIGIRKAHNLRVSTYWDRILKDEQFTIITHASHQVYDQRCARLLGASAPSLCNGGDSAAQRVFGCQAERVDKIATALVNRHCRTKEELGEAANSLIVLGVPSRTIMLRAIRELTAADITDGLAMDGIYCVLGQIGDSESIAALCDRLRHVPSKYIVYALAGHKHPKIGPALHAALCKAINSEDISSEDIGAIALEIGYQQYRPAAPDLVVALDRLTNQYFFGEVANALATLRHREAIPQIERHVARLPPSEPNSFVMSDARVALWRLTADWGVPGKSVRMHLVGPKQARLGSAIRLSIYVENIGHEPIRTWHHVEFGLQVNSTDLIKAEDRFSFGGMSAGYRRGEVMYLTYDLGPHLRKPGKYEVRYGGGKSALSSNAITIEVTPD